MEPAGAELLHLKLFQIVLAFPLFPFLCLLTCAKGTHALTCLGIFQRCLNAFYARFFIGGVTAIRRRIKEYNHQRAFLEDVGESAGNEPQ